MLAKLMNAGQVCLAPDYVLLPEESVDEFVMHARQWMAQTYGNAGSSSDYTAIINSRHVERLEALLADARERGAAVIELDDRAAVATHQRLISPALITNAPPDSRVLQEEIFGPILPLVAYATIRNAIELVRQRPTPLAMYWFGTDRTETKYVLENTRSGGITINDAMWHTLVEELPFGGVGASGMGAYHGESGFQTFSHARAVYRQTTFDITGLLGLRPPFGKRTRLALRYLVGR
jgi:coniferyl-aldehyde dehydrogenase